MISDVLSLFQDVRILSKVENLFGFRIREVESKADGSRPLSTQGLDHVQTIERELGSIQWKKFAFLQSTLIILDLSSLKKGIQYELLRPHMIPGLIILHEYGFMKVIIHHGSTVELDYGANWKNYSVLKN